MRKTMLAGAAVGATMLGAAVIYDFRRESHARARLSGPLQPGRSYTAMALLS